MIWVNFLPQLNQKVYLHFSFFSFFFLADEVLIFTVRWITSIQSSLSGMERSLSSIPFSSPHLTSSPRSLLSCVLVRPEELGWSVLSCAGSSLTKLYLDRLAFCSIGYTNFTLLLLHREREKAEERAGKEHFSPSFPGTQPDKKRGSDL